ncbi:histone-like nucleoid-structuring protein, MvaT/MvaU family [Pseudomonas mohnii]
MSLINEYRSTEKHIKELQHRLNELSSDERLQTELEFERKLRDLMEQHNKSLRDIILLLDPQALKRSGAKPVAQRRQRVVKVYKNPHTGETVQTKGGNHKTLKSWKEKHGAGEVEKWLQA